MNIRIKLAALVALSASLSAFADIKINDNLTLNGYIAGSYQYTEPSPGSASDRLNIDATRLNVVTTFKQVTGTISFWYTPTPPGAEGEMTLLDANVAYDTGQGIVITAGKFLSYLGYEAFDTINDYAISIGNQAFLAPVPGYHTGIKADYSDKDWGAGAAVVDSLYGADYYKGDGELVHNAGFEGYVTYKGIENLQIWGGVGYDTKGNLEVHSVATYDVWAQYQIVKEAFVAAEYIYKDGGTGNTGYDWLALGNYTFTDAISATLRVAGEKVDDVGKVKGPSYIKYTLCPTYKLTDHLSVRAEYSYIDYSDFSANSANFFGVQGLFTF